MHASCAAPAAPVAVPRVDAVLALVIVLLDVEAGCVTRSLSCSCAPFSGAHSLPAFLVDCAAAVAEAVAEAVAAAPPLTPRAVRGMSSSSAFNCQALTSSFILSATFAAATNNGSLCFPPPCSSTFAPPVTATTVPDAAAQRVTREGAPSESRSVPSVRESSKAVVGGARCSSASTSLSVTQPRPAVACHKSFHLSKMPL
mmetsp:Transcript_24200/g.35490  ORF Transcript_24200/g.35490 Transcript_24200/m.35490 type:complete len:200 (-) Transcript_24200:192-791(-)